VPGCTHLGPDCALDAWAAKHDDTGALTARLDSLRRLLASREGDEA
jgi:ribosome biogenesis GTPase